MSTTVGRTAGRRSAMASALNPGHRGFGEEPGQEAGPGPGDLVQMERAFAAGPARAHSAMTARIPVPALGSSTMSPGRMAAACKAA